MSVNKMAQDPWDEERYKNWVRGAKGLEFLQEGLKDFVGDKVLVCRDQQLRNILAVPVGPLPQCNQCTLQNLLPEHANPNKACARNACIQKNSGNCFGSKQKGRRKCPYGICSKLYDAIVNDHRYKDPLWTNTDPTTWCSDPYGWSFAKCFQTTPGPGQSAQETDAAGLLSILINNLSVKNWLACPNMGSKTLCPFYQARNFRNEILHKAKMELVDKTLGDYIDMFLTVLQDPKSLLTYAGSMNAVHKLTQLKSKQILITEGDEKNIRKKRIEALSEIDDKRQEALQEIEDTTGSGLTAITETCTKELAKIQVKTTSGLAAVNKTKTGALRQIKDTTKSGLTALTKKRAGAVRKLQDTTRHGLTTVIKTKTEAQREIQDTIKSGVSAVKKTRAGAVKTIQDTARCRLSDVVKTRTGALNEIEDTTKSGLKEVTKTKAGAIREIKDIQRSGIIEVSKSRTGAMQKMQDTTRSGITAVTKTRTEAVHKIQDKTRSGITKVTKTKAGAMREIQETTRSGLTALTKTKTGALQKIQDTKRSGITEVTKTRTEALQKIQDKTKCGITVVTKAKTGAMREIRDTTRSGVTAVKKTKAGTIREIEDKTRGGITAVTKAKTGAMHEIEDTARSGVTAVKKIKAGTIREIEDKTRGGITAVTKTKTDALQKIEGTASNLLEELKKQSSLSIRPDGGEPLTSSGAHSSAVVSGLQDDLIEFYRSQHSTILLSPLIEEDDTPLLEFYVMPDIHAVKRDRQGTKEEKTSVSTLRNVFYKDDKLCKEIYLTADAGLGKTSLSKRLTLAWCHAKSPNSNEKACFSEEFKEIDAMGEFAFVFLLLLRDSHKECEIDKLIWNQIVSRLENNYTLEDLQNIMSKERSLVILDGLDEWTHPSNNCDHGQSSIPHRRIRKNCTILTTTRPWKLSVSDIKSSQIDQKCEISGLSPQAANTLKKSVISHIKNVKGKYELRRHVDNFTKAVEEKHLSALETNPLLLMYLICLWCDNIELGQSQSELYSKIVELLLSRTVKKYKKDQDSLPEVESAQCNIPPCFSKQTHCRKFYTILTALGQLAFQTLFKETKEENTLVFDSSVAEQYLNKDCLTFCLSTGIITQSKVQIKLAEIQEPKVSFAHKSVQEFFAALYMHSTPDHPSVAEIVSSKCKCVKDVLDMSTVLKFIIDMNVNVASSISRELMKIINEDEITRKYRNTLKNLSDILGSVIHPLADFQDMCISCCKELPRENEVSLCLQDVFIEGRYQQEQYREHLKQLTTRNTQNIRSLYIDTSRMKDTPYNSVQKVVEYFALNGLENIEKIHCEDESNGDNILPLLYRSVKCLFLSCGWQQQPGSWSRLLGERVATLQKLEAIKIYKFDIGHSEWTLLCNYISHRHCMRQIVLKELYCTDHEYSCTGVILDLSQHPQLSELTLYRIPVRTVNVNMAALEQCYLQLYKRDLVLRFVNCDPADSKLNTFTCQGLKSRAAIDTVLDTLPGLHQVKHVELSYINLGDRELKLSSEMKNLERVELDWVTMAASSLRGVVDCVDQLPQTVEVDIGHCTITPEREFVTVRDKIKTSPRFRVIEVSKDFHGRPIKDWKNEDGEITVMFATIKE